MTTRHFLSLSQTSPKELEDLIERASQMKALHYSHNGKKHFPLAGKTLGLLFFKSSTRTRISFESAMVQLGGASLYLSAQDLQLHRGESVSDTARVLSRYLNALVIRTFGHDTVEEWASEATIPVINGLTDLHHPCQVLGDLLTLKEKFHSLKGLTVTYIGDGNNIAHSLIEGAARCGMILRIACPPSHQPDKDIVESSKEAAQLTGARIEVMTDPFEAAQDADALYTDVWTSMGQEEESREREKTFALYRIDSKLLKKAKPSACVMHCLPAHRGQEITAEVLEGPQSVVWDQAENRLHAQKALLEWLIHE